MSNWWLQGNALLYLNNPSFNAQIMLLVKGAHGAAMVMWGFPQSSSDQSPHARKFALAHAIWAQVSRSGWPTSMWLLCLREEKAVAWTWGWTAGAPEDVRAKTGGGGEEESLGNFSGGGEDICGNMMQQDARQLHTFRRDVRPFFMRARRHARGWWMKPALRTTQTPITDSRFTERAGGCDL
jgi:hypothetical protein